MLEAVGEAEAAGVLPASLAEFLRGAADVLPIDQLVGWATDDAPPCDPVAWGDTQQDMGRVTARIALDGVARAACALKVPVADVVVAAGSTDTLGTLAQQAGIAAGAGRGRRQPGRAATPSTPPTRPARSTRTPPTS